MTIKLKCFSFYHWICFISKIFMTVICNSVLSMKFKERRKICPILQEICVTPLQFRTKSKVLPQMFNISCGVLKKLLYSCTITIWQKRFLLIFFVITSHWHKGQKQILLILTCWLLKNVIVDSFHLHVTNDFHPNPILLFSRSKGGYTVEDTKTPVSTNSYPLKI